jgi:peptidoglycan/xylan/chitin deacetylase (PgdA/CDA1 family)
MKTAFASVVKAGLLKVGHYARRLRASRFPGVAVLCYHGVRGDESPRDVVTFENLHVRVSELEAHCRLIRDTCHPISLRQWRDARARGVSLPERSVLFTFDDGYRTVFTLAKPVLQRYAIPAVVFVCSEPVEQQHLFWHDAVARSQGESEVYRIKRLPFEQWAEVTATSRSRVNDADANAPLSIAEVQALASERVEIGAHTAEHPILARAGVREQERQILSNRRALENWIGQPVLAFAYPNGQRDDYTSETVNVLERLGFDFAFTTKSGFATAVEGPFEFSRFVMLAGVGPAELAHRLTYSWRQSWLESAL